jgi:hypothetical protein
MKFLRFDIVALLAGLLVWMACAQSGQTVNKRSQAGGKSDSKNGEEKSEDGTDPEFDSLGFFSENVHPVFKDKCVGCHVGADVPVESRGPMTIYDEQAMRPMLMEGGSAEGNNLVLKVLGKITHGGGDRCNGKPTNSPCLEIVQWWAGLYGKDESKKPGKPGTTKPGEPGTTAPLGEIVDIGLDGFITGYAVSSEAKDKPATVALYLGGDETTGTSLGEHLANKNGYDNGNGGTHVFKHKIPDEMIDSGKESEVYGYIVEGGEKFPLEGSPFKFYAYTPQARDVFTSEVLPLLEGNCDSCHGTPSYEVWFPDLLSPAPHTGGTATTNIMYVKASGGASHSGGNRCSGNNLCAAIQSWWNAEFATP